MRYHLFQKFFGKMVKIKEMSFLSTRGMILIFRNCIAGNEVAFAIYAALHTCGQIDPFLPEIGLSY